MTIVAEVYARRLDSPLDSVLKLTDAAGKQLAFNDDHEDKGAGLDTHYADSYSRPRCPPTAPTISTSATRSTRAARSMPTACASARRGLISLAGGAVQRQRPRRRLAFLLRCTRSPRRFSNEISLALKDAPEGFTLTGAKVPANQDQVRLTLKAPPTPGRAGRSAPGRAARPFRGGRSPTRPCRRRT